MTMSEVVDTLVMKTKIECEDVLRRMIKATNGLASLKALERSVLPRRTLYRSQCLVDAVQLYRESLRLMEEYDSLIEADSLQKIHVLHNLRNPLHIFSEDSDFKGLIEKREVRIYMYRRNNNHSRPHHLPRHSLLIFLESDNLLIFRYMLSHQP